MEGFPEKSITQKKMNYENLKIDEAIFKAYDIRGVYPEQLNEDVAYLIGRAFVSFLGCRNVVVGRDARLSSPTIFKALVAGLTDQGADVYSIGLSTTPMLYFSVGYYKYEAGIMITASHNPSEYNGLKLIKHSAIPIGKDNGMEDIKHVVLTRKFPKPERKGKLAELDVMDDYLSFILSKVKRIDTFKLVIDAGNAMAGYTLPKFLESLPLKVVKMFFELDLTFPNHEANPLNFDTLRELQKRVVEEKAHLGVAFDGDADRVFFTDEKGSIISSDYVTALMAQHILTKQPNSVVLYDLRSSWVVKEVIQQAGGIPMMCRVGHAFIKQMMRQHNAVFAGELSGHYYYREHFYTESSVLTMLYLIELMTELKKPLSEIVAPLKKYYRSEEINFKVKDKHAALRAFEENFFGNSISHLDGVKVETENYWINLRPSNTEPLIRLTAEAKEKAILERLIRETKELLKPYIV